MSAFKSIVIRPVLGRRTPDVMIDGIRVADDQVKFAHEPVFPTHIVISRAEYDAMTSSGDGQKQSSANKQLALLSTLDDAIKGLFELAHAKATPPEVKCQALTSIAFAAREALQILDRQGLAKAN